MALPATDPDRPLTTREDATPTLHERVLVALDRGDRALAMSRMLLEENARIRRALRQTCETAERRRRMRRPAQDA